MLELVPVDANMYEAADVPHEHRPQRQQGPEIQAVGDFQLQRHDGDAAVAESF